MTKTKTGITPEHRAGYGEGRDRVTSQRQSRVQFRAADGDQSPMVYGYAAVYYREGDPSTEYWLWNTMVERIRPGAFDRALAERQDTRGLFNHDVSYLLGRVAAGTCRLRSDEIGLHYEIDLDPEMRAHADLLRMCQRGDITGSSFSFGFGAQKPSYTEMPDYDVRWLEDLDLFDVGPVTFPAYSGTTSASRSVGSIEAIEAEFQAYRMQQMDAVAEDSDVSIAAALARLCD